MSEKRHELYLIAFALVCAAVLILYIAFDSPQLNAMEIPANHNAAFDDSQDEESGLSQTQSFEAGTALQPEANETDTQHSQADVVAAKPQAAAVSPKYSGPVNINTATKEQLMTLSGIGEVKAAAILEYRRENGSFYTVDELTNVKGIGEKTLEKIRGNIKV